MGRLESQRGDDGLDGRVRAGLRGRDEHTRGTAPQHEAGRGSAGPVVCARDKSRTGHEVSLPLQGRTGSGGKTKVSQTVEVKGPLGPILAPMMGPQVSKEFGTLLANLARKAEAS
jgi:hypothetical protein